MEHAPVIVVIGASAGGVEALLKLVAALPTNLRAAIFIVLHVGSHKSELPWLLDRLDGLPAKHAVDGDLINVGQIYVAPPDHHMVIEKGSIALTKGPRENWARPAIDPLFRSAADVYESNVIGVILTGALNDGTAGLYQVAQAGGMTVVQSPADAINPSMPESALAHVAVDHCLPLVEIAPLLIELVDERSKSQTLGARAENEQPQEEKEMAAEFTQNLPVAVTCPDCGGALRRRELGSLTQFACHIGHIYTAEVMMAAQFLTLERFIESAMRSLAERAELCRQMSEKSRSDKLALDGANWEAAMREAKDQTQPLREMLTREWIHPTLNSAVGDMNP
jgi:two-component system chemotaxis response regulator CheB